MEASRGGHPKGSAEDRHHEPRTHHPGRAQRQGLRRGRKGHRPEDRPGRQHPGQQAGGEDHALEAEIAKAPKEMAPLMDTLLAEWYWQYFQQNRWRFMQRTAIAEQPGKDFTTWDLPRLLDRKSTRL